jgi:hypothetical protein
VHVAFHSKRGELVRLRSMFGHKRIQVGSLHVSAPGEKMRDRGNIHSFSLACLLDGRKHFIKARTSSPELREKHRSYIR